jgi:hypothetical protein
MTRIRIIGLAFVAVFALSAVAASAASAHTFKAEKSPVTVKAKAENAQGFKVASTVSVCKKAKFLGTGTSGAETLEVHPEYEECEVGLEGTGKANVETTGCNYVFHAAAPSTSEGSVDIKCEGTHVIKVNVVKLGCEITVGPQTGLKKIEYVNEGALTLRKVKVNANVTGIKWGSNCTQLKAGGSEGEYREGMFNSVTKAPELGSGPAVALSEGIFEESADGIWVE